EPPGTFHRMDRALGLFHVHDQLSPHRWVRPARCKASTKCVARRGLTLARSASAAWKPSTGGWSGEYVDRLAGCHRVVEVKRIDEKTVDGERPVPRPLLYLPSPGK
ncbi:MAG: hypothetical protein N2C14_05730, partial [Planctomycetales bacterium]